MKNILLLLLISATALHAEKRKLSDILFRSPSPTQHHTKANKHTKLTITPVLNPLDTTYELALLDGTLKDSCTWEPQPPLPLQSVSKDILLKKLKILRKLYNTHNELTNNDSEKLTKRVAQLHNYLYNSNFCAHEITARDTNKNTPLHYIAQLNLVFECVLLLRAAHYAKVEVDVLNNRGETPLFIAATFGNYEILKTLIEHKHAINICANNKETPLIRAIKGYNALKALRAYAFEDSIGEEHYLACVKILIKAGAYLKQEQLDTLQATPDPALIPLLSDVCVYEDPSLNT